MFPNPGFPSFNKVSKPVKVVCKKVISSISKWVISSPSHMILAPFVSKYYPFPIIPTLKTI